MAYQLAMVAEHSGNALIEVLQALHLIEPDAPAGLALTLLVFSCIVIVVEQ